MDQSTARAKRRKRNLARRNRQLAELAESLDLNLLFTLVFILAFGLLMVYSASSYVALRDWGDQTHFFSRQLTADLLGLAVMIIVIFLPLRLFQVAGVGLYVVSYVLIFLVLTPLGIESHNARRWIAIPGTGFNLQPAEVAKLAVIIFLAAIINQLGKEINTLKGILFPVAITLPVCGVIYGVTDNLSSALIIAGIAFVMCFVASRNYKWYILIVVIGAAIAAGIVAYVANTDLDSDASFRLGRISAWIHPENSTESAAHQALQSMYAIGNGGVFGVGLGHSVQKISALPEPHNDMIFAIICEELGIVGAVALILLFVMLLFQMYRVARSTRNRFRFLLVVGVMAHIAIQTVLNIAVATNSIPNTGVSLPFISYGGSSVMFLLIEVGLVLNVNRQNRLEAMRE